MFGENHNLSRYICDDLLEFLEKNYCPYRESGLDDHSDLEHYIAPLQRLDKSGSFCVMKRVLFKVYY